MSQTVIQVVNVGKQYRLGLIGSGTIAEDVSGFLKRVSGGDSGNSLTRNEKKTIWAVKDISFEVCQGEVLGIIGKNGAGKSTLLKILSQITQPTTGEVRIKGKVASLLEVGTGFHPELSGRENVFLNGAILGMKRSEIKSKFDEIVDFSGVEKFIDTPVKRYSSGMYVRLAFAVAAHLEPEILIVDEVLAVGDMEFQKKCLGRMKDVAGRGRTVLFVSHNLIAVKNLCTRTILLEQGELSFSGPSSEAVDRYLNYAPSVSGSIVTADEIKARCREYSTTGEKYFNCEEIKITNIKGDAINEFNSDEEILILIKFKCLQKNHNLNIMVSLVNEENDNIVLVESMDCESYEQSLPLAEGVYQVTCTIPRNMFGQKTFHVNVSLLYYGVYHQVFNKILFFKVNYFGYNHRTKLNYGGDWAYVRPNYNWETIKIH